MSQREEKPYEVRAIAPTVLKALRERDDAGRSRPRVVLESEGGSPMRCCLGRSEPGETVGLVSYAPLRRWAAETGARPGPYDEVGPVFIHLQDCGGPAAAAADAAGTGDRATGAVPEGVCGERRVLRAYDAAGSILGGRLVEGADRAAVEAVLDDLYRDPAVAAVHLRAVEYGCFLMETRRLETRRR